MSRRDIGRRPWGNSISSKLLSYISTLFKGVFLMIIFVNLAVPLTSLGGWDRVVVTLRDITSKVIGADNKQIRKNLSSKFEIVLKWIF